MMAVSVTSSAEAVKYHPHIPYMSKIKSTLLRCSITAELLLPGCPSVPLPVHTACTAEGYDCTRGCAPSLPQGLQLA